MKLNRKYFLFIVLLFAALQSTAQVQFEMVVSAKEIGKRDEVQVEYVISGANKISDFKLPYFEKWTVMSGPSSTTEIYSIDGARSTRYKYIYVVSPVTSGKLVLPGTTVMADGRTIKCKNVVVTVKRQDRVAGASASAYSQPQAEVVIDDERGTEDFKEYELKPGEDPMQKIRNNLFIRAIPSKNKCFVGEPVMVTYKLYTRLRSNSRVTKQPSFTGCSVSEMTTSDMKAVVETLNGKKYKTYIFRRVQLFPLQAGRITGGTASVDHTVEFAIRNSDPRRSYYESDAVNRYELSMSTEPFIVDVMPLPGNSRAAAVGDFEIFTALKKDTIAANQTNSLIVTIAGRGNFISVGEPEIQWPDKLYHFDPIENNEIDKLSFPMAGRKVFEIPFEASSTGSIDISPVAFSYFDPSKGVYKTVKSQPLHLTVTPAIKANLRQSIIGNEEGSSIRYLVYLLPVVFLLGALIIWKMPRKNNRDVVNIAPQPAEPAMPVNYDLDAKMDALVLIQDDVEFYSAARELAKDLIGMGRGDHDLLLSVLQDCNTVLYTPMATTSRKEILDQLRRAVG